MWNRGIDALNNPNNECFVSVSVVCYGKKNIQKIQAQETAEQAADTFYYSSTRSYSTGFNSSNFAF